MGKPKYVSPEDQWLQGQRLLQDVISRFSDTGAMERSYGGAKRRFMGSAMSQAVNTGMANMLNLPAMELAYERETRPQFEMSKQSRLAEAMTNMANYLATYAQHREGLAMQQTAQQNARLGTMLQYKAATQPPRESLSDKWDRQWEAFRQAPRGDTGGSFFSSPAAVPSVSAFTDLPSPFARLR